MGIGLSPRDLDRNRALVIVDMRPEGERTCELGFIPGSVLLPMGNDVVAFAERLAHLGSDGPVVLTCVSGRRSGDAVRALEPLLGPTRHLEGGLLAWGAAGFPLCFPAANQGAAVDFHGAFRSAFLAELIEVSLERGLHFDPLDYLRYVYSAQGLAPPLRPTPERPGRRHWPLLDRAAAVLRILGADGDQIVRFLTPLYAV